MRRSCQRAKVSIIGLFHHSADPTNVVGQFGVYAELSAFSATFAKTRDAKYGPGAIRSPGILAQKGSSAVTRAWIHLPATISRAEHVIGDSIVFVDGSTRFWRYYGYLQLRMNGRISLADFLRRLTDIVTFLGKDNYSWIIFSLTVVENVTTEKQSFSKIREFSRRYGRNFTSFSRFGRTNERTRASWRTSVPKSSVTRDFPQPIMVHSWLAGRGWLGAGRQATPLDDDAVNVTGRRSIATSLSTVSASYSGCIVTESTWGNENLIEY